MDLVFKNSNRVIIHNTNRTLRCGRWWNIPFTAAWRSLAWNTGGGRRYLFNTLSSVVNSVNNVTFQTTTISPYYDSFIGCAFSEDYPYNELSYMWADYHATCSQFHFAIPTTLRSRPWYRIVIDLYNGGATLRSWQGTSNNPVHAFFNHWYNNANQNILFGISLTTSRPTTPAGAGTAHFTVGINEMTDYSRNGNAGISTDLGGYWSMFINSNRGWNGVATSTLLGNLQGAANIYMTVRPTSFPAFAIPTNYSKVEHAQNVRTGRPSLWIYA
jgi:hypothetical protein